MNLRIFVLGASLLIAPTLALHSAAAAYKQKILYSFCASGSCTDGEEPSGVSRDTAGNLYGTTGGGGRFGAGTVFELVPPPAGKTGWTY